MRPSLMLACGAAWMLLASASHASAQDAKGQPFELVRSLQSLQDQVVRGNTRAHAAQRVLITQIRDNFDNLTAEAWRDPKNAKAAVVFVLSGGNASVLHKLMASDGGKLVDERLVRGALAFGEGRLEQAREMLGGVDARVLDPGMAGHVAYVQGELASKKDAAKALAYFDDARLLSPGTIVEEAALRRQIGLLSDGRDTDRYSLLGAQYLRRFPNSVYADVFRQQFAKAIARTNGKDAHRLARLDDLLGGIPQAERRHVYLAMAKESLDQGNVDVARLAAAHAARLAEDHSPERERARLYEAAALVATDDLERGLEALNDLDQSKLAEADVALRDAALSIAAQVRRLPEASDAAADGDGLEASPLLRNARKAIAQVDEMLSKAGKP